MCCMTVGTVGGESGRMWRRILYQQPVDTEIFQGETFSGGGSLGHMSIVNWVRNEGHQESPNSLLST